MPADRKQVEAAVERLNQVVRYERDDMNTSDLRLVLTDHAALLARAEAAEAARDQAYLDGRYDGEAVGEYQRMEAIGRSVETSLAAHQPPAPVKAGGEDRAITCMQTGMPIDGRCVACGDGPCVADRPHSKDMRSGGGDQR